MADYIPSNDVYFSSWVDNFLSYLSANVAHFGMTGEEIESLADELSPAYQTAVLAHHQARNAAKSAGSQKEITRGELESAIRAVVARIQAYPATTNVDRDALGIPRRGESNSPANVPALDSRPSAIIDIRPHLKHVLRIHSENDVSPKAGKPPGVKGCEIWVKTGSAPENINDMTYVGTSTRNPFIVTFQNEDANKMAYYRFRYLDSKGVPGDWSEVDSATIAA